MFLFYLLLLFLFIFFFFMQTQVKMVTQHTRQRRLLPRGTRASRRATPTTSTTMRSPMGTVPGPGALCPMCRSTMPRSPRCRRDRVRSKRSDCLVIVIVPAAHTVEPVVPHTNVSWCYGVALLTINHLLFSVSDPDSD